MNLNKRMIFKSAFFFFLICFLAFGSKLQANDVPGDGIVAIVNDDIIISQESGSIDPDT